MANTYTTTYNLIKPEVGSDTNAWGTHLNADLDTIDSNMLSRSLTSAQTMAGALNLPTNGLNVGSGQLQVTGGNVSASGNVSSSGNVAATGNVTGAAGTFSGTVTATTFSGHWENLPAGTALLFVQTNAPTGWTKSTTHNNKALRVVSGAASSGGTVAFSTAFASQAVSGTVGSYTLTAADIPSHTHTATSTDAGHIHYMGKNAATGSGGGGGGQFMDTTGTGGYNATTTGNASITTTIGSTGGGGGHSHSFTGTAINLAVQYVDVIIATKD